MELGAVQPQEFDWFVVIDFEATCEEGTRIYPQEIIEFPSVLVNGATGQQHEEPPFQTYIRPVHHPQLTEFCTKLTGIQQHDVVDRGVPLREALGAHGAWLEARGVMNGGGRFAVVTWGDWDCRTMLDSECQFKQIEKPEYFNRWINLKVPFNEVFGGGRGIGLEDALQLAGLPFEGRPHSGLDDSRNIARLLTLLMHRGVRLAITGSLSPPPPQPHPQTDAPPPA